MNVRKSFRYARALITALFLVSLMAPIAATAGPRQDVSAKIDARVLEQTTQGNSNVWVLLHQKADLSPAPAISDWAERGRFVVKQLQTVADTSQAGIRGLLRSQGLQFKYFWIVNAIQVTADVATIKQLAARPEVDQIVPSRTYQLPQPLPGKDEATINAVEWGLTNIGAPDVWSTFGIRGEGIVIANIDSGVQFDHPALVQQYRGRLGPGSYDHNYNWFDPSSICGSPSLVPCDNNNHGTHTMGTMVGDDGDPGPNQIGVAPKATWIAAKGCEANSCSDAALLASGQWMLAPTNLAGQLPRADLRPHIVNNSWGSDNGSDTFYQATVQAWVASGIFPAFSNGNAGPGCGTVGSPGSYAESYGVGAYDITNTIAGFSSRGPSPLGGIKPGISAPGVNVRSSVAGNGYASFNGTSMAAPHLAGAVALMWSAAPALIGDIAATRALLDQTATDTSNLTCGGTAANNNVFGEGRLNAFAAVDQSPRGPQGTLAGVVTDAAGQPVVGATVRAVSGTTDKTTLTDPAGAYSLLLPTGTYDVDSTAFGYLPANASGVVINDNATTPQNFALAVAPTNGVSGVVRDSNYAPVPNATVTILDSPIPPATTNSSGTYSFPSVPHGTYQALAAATGRCNDPQTQALIVNGPETANFLLAQRSDSFGYRCRVEPASFIDANTVLPLTGDDAATSVALPFPFTFYGQTYNTAYVSTNGHLNFAAQSIALINETLPSPNLPNAAIYPFWDDLFVDASASVRTELLGTAPNRIFVVEWRNLHFFADTSRRVRFEVLLSENGQISMQYADLAADTREQGGSATVGIENPSGTVAMQHSFNEAALGAPAYSVRYYVPVNQVRNSGFELDANGDTFPDSWSTNARFTRSNALVQSGSFAGRHFATDNGNHAIFEAVAATPGTLYNVGGWVNIPPTADTFAFYLAVQWRNAANGVIRTQVIRADTAQTSGWSQTSVPLVAPAGTAYALVVMVANNLNATIYVDDISFARP